MSKEPHGSMGGAGEKGVPLHPNPGSQGPWFPQPGFPPMSQGWVSSSQPWVPPTSQPWTPSSQSWGGPWGVPNYSQSTTPNVWSHPPTTTTTMTTNASGNVVPDEYTVDTLRRIYDNDDGRIEIQRVKVQRRPAAADVRGLTYPGFDSMAGMSSPDNMSIVSADSFPLNERRPPPRKNKKKKEGQVAQMQGQPQQGPYPWYPHMPYMPYPYPYCFGYMWPPPPPTVGLGNTPMMFPVNSQCYPAGSEVESEERSSSRLDSLPTTLDSFSRLESLNFRPDSQLSESRASRRSLSPTAASQVADSQVTDIGPSDSISVRGYKGEPSLDWALHDARIHGPAGSSSTLDKDRNRTKMKNEEKHLEPDPTSGAPVRPRRRNANHMSPEEVYSRAKKKTELRSPSKETLSQGESGSQISNDLMYAIRKFERSVNDVPSVDMDNTVDDEKSVSKLSSVSKDSKTPKKTPTTLPVSKSDQKDMDKDDQKIQPPSRRKRTLVRSGDTEADGRVSRTSTTSFLSLQRSTDDVPPIDTDSTDIPILASDFATGDESDSTLGGYKTSMVEEEIATAGGYKWIIQQPGETPQLVGLPNKGDAAREDERRNAWRTEVSLWRARLVVSLCRGRGLDRQDWATFHLLVRHPLSLDLKLSLLHAPRLCAANAKQGAPMVRIALLHLAQYGEMLLQAESSRQDGWKIIKVDASLPWVPVKGSTEILHVLGYRAHEEGFLRFSRRKAPETSLIARLTLDMLVLAEELRLYITGGHQCPNNVSDLFPPAESESLTPTSINVNEKSAKVLDIKNDSSKSDEKRPVSPPSCSFVSAHSTPSHTDEETETLHVSVRQNHKDNSKQIERYSSSEDEKTLRAYTDNQVHKETLNDKSPSKESTPEPEIADAHLPLDVNEPETSATAQELPEPPSHSSQVPSSLDEKSQVTNTSSLPDLQSLSTTTAPKKDGNSDPLRCSSATPTAPAASKPKSSSQKENSKDNPDDHIYEEIGDVKAQVEALRQASVSTSSLPPPLPPKARTSSGVEDDSGLSLTYPKMDWSITSQDGSLRGGSTGVRKKKRRAPMPPSFMPPNWAESDAADENKENINNLHKSLSEKDVFQNANLGEAKAADTKKFKSQQSLNPFYEDSITETEADKCSVALSSHVEERPPRKKKSLNPFYEDKIVPSGYVGKNPFYEDVDTVKKTIMSDLSTADSIVQSVATGTHTKSSKSYDDIPVVRPKRKAPRPPLSPAPGPDSDSSKKSKGNVTPEENKEMLSQTTSSSAEMMLNSSANDTSNRSETNTVSATEEPLLIKSKSDTESKVIASSSEEDGSLRVQTKVSSLPGTDTISASTAGLQATGSTDGTSAAPLSGQGRKQLSSNTTTASGTAHISAEETVPVSLTGAMSDLESRNTSHISEKIKSPPEGTAKDAVRRVTSAEEASKLASNTEVGASTSTATSNEKLSTSDSKMPVTSSTTSSTVYAKQGTSPSTTEKTSRPASLMVEQGLQGRDISVAGTSASDTLTLKRETLEANDASSHIKPPGKPLSLTDDIPYIDNSDVTYYRSKGMANRTNNQRASLFLHEKTSPPFIDDDDLPPNRPPPPPPSSPPPSPPASPPPSPPPSPATNPPNYISERVSDTTSGTYVNTTNKLDAPSLSITSTTFVASASVATPVSCTINSSVAFATTATPVTTASLVTTVVTVVSASPTSTTVGASAQTVASTTNEFPPLIDAPLKEDVPLRAVTSLTATPVSDVISAPGVSPITTSSSIAAVSSTPAAIPGVKLKSSEKPPSESQYEIPEVPSTPVSTETKKISPPPRSLPLKPRELSPEAEERYEIPEAPKNPQDSRNLSVAADPSFARLSPIKEASTYSQASESDRYEIPENLTNTSGPTRMSRLDPPRASTQSKPVEGRKNVPSRILDDRGSGDLSQMNSRNSDSVIPPRPPRRRRSLRPPPRPPKAPLKGSGELVSTLSPITGQERCFHSSVSLSSYSTVTTQGSSVSSTLAQSPMSSEPSTPLGNYPVHSQVVTNDSKKKSTLKSRLRKSWPLLLCECIYANCHPLESTERDSSPSDKKPE